MDQQLRARSAMHAALGDPQRLQIVDYLTVTDATATQLAQDLDVAPNLLSFHLRRLLEAGVVRRRQSDVDGRTFYLALTAAGAALAGQDQLSVAAHERVVFVCTHNSARSVLARAYWQQQTGQAAESGGTRPAPRVHPLARASARRARLDLTGIRPRSIAGRINERDMVVTVCDSAAAELPEHGGPRLHWSVPDPALHDDPAAFDGALADLQHRIDRLVQANAQPKESP